MALTYKGDLSTDLDKVRFYTQDTTADSGPKPGGDNFSDAEITGLITSEGSWRRAVAAAFETLAGLWGQYVDLSVGPRREQLSQTAARYESLAATWRRKWGSSGSRAGSRAVTRVDGYSDDIPSDQV